MLFYFSAFFPTFNRFSIILAFFKILHNFRLSLPVQHLTTSLWFLLRFVCSVADFTKKLQLNYRKHKNRQKHARFLSYIFYVKITLSLDFFRKFPKILKIAINLDQQNPVHFGQKEGQKFKFCFSKVEFVVKNDHQ